MIIYNHNEYDSLEYCLLAYPKNFDIKEIINKMQRKYKGQIDFELAYSQFHSLANTLIKHGVKVQFLDLVDSPEQVFTRDIGFVIHNILFVSHMAKHIRGEEPDALLSFLEDKSVKVHQMHYTAEGGDVFIHNNLCFVGISHRTSAEGIQEIEQVLNNHQLKIEVIPVHFNIDLLHLDCVFNILDANTCIITDYIYNPEVIEKHFKKIVKIEGKQVEYLATNFVHIGNKKMICTNSFMAAKLSELGYNPIYLDYTEFIKSGGSVRCSTLPIKRQTK